MVSGPGSGEKDSKLIFILGGTRSGKSDYGLKLAESIDGKRLYLATALGLDSEMRERIAKHQKQRDKKWTTIEEPIQIIDVIKGNKDYNVILLDCLTLWLSNLMHEKIGGRGQESGDRKKIGNLISTCKKSNTNIIVVSNEVGMGIVPDNSLARQFRDIAGFANQKMAETADEVWFVVSGIAMRMK